MSTARVSWQVLHQRCRPTTIQEIPVYSSVVSVGAVEAPIEVWCEIDVLTVEDSWGEDARHVDADIGLGVVPDHDSIDEERENCVLRGWGIVLEEGVGVIVADRRVSRALSEGGRHGEGEEKGGDVLGIHLCRSVLNVLPVAGALTKGLVRIGQIIPSLLSQHGISLGSASVGIALHIHRASAIVQQCAAACYC